MENSQIRTLSYIENEDHPVFGTLVEQILHLLNSKLVFSDILIHQNSPLLLRQPKGMVAVTDSPITREELEEFFEVVEPNWRERIQDRAFDRAIDLHTARIRANCFSFQGKKRLGCVVRRFPREPLPLANLGLRTNEAKFAHLTSGLLLIIGDTCQGKSRPDVIVIGEIRDAETAREALALAESGPLVLASLHARSTELGLQKMMRLLGNSESQNQALAHALRGVLCQALLPAQDNDGYHLATESLTVHPEVKELIESANLSGIRQLMEHKGAEGCHTMNASLRELLAKKKVGVDDARNATTDRIGFADMM
ncbi:ATPase, T2SS/T4P/T4SS family [Pseudoduganella sp. RAF53_2]|uniref:ATPase, T2SS/T4P/T4SS family n=1 Tax=Pseudoduganella sp. RAF53_2 TaxID=3233060 RepID=UPI003F99DD75